MLKFHLGPFSKTLPHLIDSDIRNIEQNENYKYFTILDKFITHSSYNKERPIPGMKVDNNCLTKNFRKNLTISQTIKLFI